MKPDNYEDRDKTGKKNQKWENKGQTQGKRGTQDVIQSHQVSAEFCPGSGLSPWLSDLTPGDLLSYPDVSTHAAELVATAQTPLLLEKAKGSSLCCDNTRARNSVEHCCALMTQAVTLAQV